jgi:hypothetical protein
MMNAFSLLYAYMFPAKIRLASADFFGRLPIRNRDDVDPLALELLVVRRRQRLEREFQPAYSPAPDIASIHA